MQFPIDSSWLANQTKQTLSHRSSWHCHARLRYTPHSSSAFLTTADCGSTPPTKPTIQADGEARAAGWRLDGTKKKQKKNKSEREMWTE